MPKPESQIPDNQVLPDAQLEKRTRRRFSTEYKLRILTEADQCAHGELGQLLRRENLYSNQLHDWRKQLEAGGEAALSKSTPGPKASKTPEQKRIEQLEKELAKTQHRLRVTEDCVDLQKSLVDARSVEQWERSVLMVLEQRPAHMPLSLACEVLGLNRSTVYARQRGKTPMNPQMRSRKKASQPRALSVSERQAILDRMNRPEFWDQTAYQAFTLLEQGECLLLTADSPSTAFCVRAHKLLSPCRLPLFASQSLRSSVKFDRYWRHPPFTVSFYRHKLS